MWIEKYYDFTLDSCRDIGFFKISFGSPFPDSLSESEETEGNLGDPEGSGFLDHFAAGIAANGSGVCFISLCFLKP